MSRMTQSITTSNERNSVILILNFAVTEDQKSTMRQAWTVALTTVIVIWKSQGISSFFVKFGNTLDQNLLSSYHTNNIVIAST